MNSDSVKKMNKEKINTNLEQFSVFKCVLNSAVLTPYQVCKSV